MKHETEPVLKSKVDNPVAAVIDTMDCGGAVRGVVKCAASGF